MEGLTVGEKRFIRVAIPFQTQQLLRICELQSETAPEELSEGQVSRQEEPTAEHDNEKALQGHSLVPAYLESIANKSKEDVFSALFGKAKSARDDAEKPTMLTGSSPPTQEGAEHEKYGTAEDELPTDLDGSVVHNVDCLLEVECLDVKQRVAPKADGPQELLLVPFKCFLVHLGSVC